MKVDELLPYLKQQGKAIIAGILGGTYRPKSVGRVVKSPILETKLTSTYLEKLGYASIYKRYKQIH